MTARKPLVTELWPSRIVPVREPREEEPEPLYQRLEPGDDLQAAIDRAPKYGVIEMAIGAWRPPYPVVWHKDNLTVRGAGKNRTTVQSSIPGADGVLFLKLLPPRGDERVPLAGLLDPSVGDGYGFRLPNKRRLAGLMGGGAAQRTHAYLKRDWWAGVRQFTLEFAVRCARTHGDTAKFLGFDEFEDNPEPWLVVNNSHVGVWEFTFKDAAGFRHGCPIPTGGDVTNGVQRVCLQLDFARGTSVAWVNNRRVAVSVNTSVWVGDHWEGQLLPWAGVHFHAAESSEFSVWGTPHDPDLLGLKWTPALIYDETQETQVRLDGREANDHHRYFARDPETGSVNWALSREWCGRELPEGQRSFVHDRMARADAGFLYEILYILEDENASPWNSTNGNVLEDLSLWGNAGGGQGLTVGASLHLTVNRVAADLGWAKGLGAMKVPVSYPCGYADCNFDGVDSSVHLQGQTAYFTGKLTLGYGGRWFFYSQGSGGSWENVFCNSPDGGYMQYYGVFRNSDDAGGVTLTNFGVDDEGAGAATLKAGFLGRASAAGAFDIIYQNVRIHLPRADLPVFLLESSHGSDRPCRLMTQAVSIDQGSAVAKVCSPRWSVGKVSDYDTGKPWRTDDSAPEPAPDGGGGPGVRR